MRKIVSLLTLSLLLTIVCRSQGRISGTVRDQNGDLVPFATINVKGTKVSTAADANANFTIPAKTGDVLVISAVGIDKTEVTVGAESVMSVTVTRTSGNIADVVVTTALGIKRSKNELPYSVQQVSGDELSKQRSANFLTNLEGRVSGLTLNQSNTLGGSTNIILRGYKSITGDNQALIVIDGVPFNNTNTNSAAQTTGRGGFDYGNAAADINPDDIESVSVLKGAAASALYGERGFNGVILITTKKGRRGLGVTVNAGITTGSIDKSTFAKYQHEYGANYGPLGYGSPDGNFLYFDVDGDGSPDLVTPTTEDASWGAPFDPSLMVFQWDAFDKTSKYYHQARPWVAAANDPVTFFTKPFGYNTSAIISGGNDKASFNLDYTRNDDKGILPNSEIIKNLVNFTSSLNITSRLTASASVNYSRIDGKGRYGTGYDPSNPATNFRQWWETNVDIKELKDAYFRNHENITWNWADPSDEQNGLVPIYWNNPYFDRYENYETDSRSRYFSNLSLNYKATDWLNILARVSVDHYDEIQEQRYAVGSIGVSYYSRYNHAYNETNYDLLLNFDKDITSKLNLKGLLGTNIRKTYNNSIYVSTNGGLIIPRLYTLSNSVSTPLAPTEGTSLVEVDGVFAGATLTYNKILTLDGTIRRDASSTLPEGNNVYYYPSVSGGFIFSELMKGSSWLSYGKLRANYATVGHAAPAYSVNDTYTIGTPFNGQAVATASLTKNNPDLVPEKNKSYEFGIEANFLRNRAGFDVTYYHARTFNQIIPVQISSATGYASKFLNAGTVQNAGIEISLNGTPVKTKNFSWDISVNWTRNRNKVIALFDTAKNLSLASFQGGVTLNATVGQPFGEIRGSDYVYTDGQRIVKSNGFYQISSTSNNVIGNANPDWIGSITNTFHYKDFSLSFLIDTRRGGDIFSLDLYYGLATGLYPETAGKNDLGNPVRNSLDDGGGVIFPGVTADGKPNTTRADLHSIFGGFGYYRNPAAAFIYDASFVKLREVALSYSLPSSIINKLAPFKGIDISVVGRNLWIIHKNLPYADPEDIISSGNFALGYQGGSYPTARTYTFNLKFRF
jgi:TonB-linked SusC/RagA family outer membrane protein